MPQSPQPLAERIRPRDLGGFIGQAHLVGAGKPLSRALQQRTVPSMVLWGPPGVGKTTLARMIADVAGKPFYNLSAVSAGKAELRNIVNSLGRAQASQPGLFQADQDPQPNSAILFLDEIHRFNKAQQDFLLPYVEDGTITLIGATTENPSFEVISALLSRMQVFTLEPLTVRELEQIIARGVEALQLEIEPEAVAFLANYANGDARAALNLLENAARLYRADAIIAEHLRETLQSKHLRYDKSGEEHYNTISAFIKSMRASDIDAALYYLARMVDSGEDPKFIARRMVIFASEDVGMADSAALTVANDVFRAVETIGLPECQFHLAHGVVYLAGAPKDRSAGSGYFDALEDARQHGNLPVPLRLRNAPTALMRQLGYGKGYQAYTDESLLPEELAGKRYFRP
ncbi:MAG: replication-associated recombination protein A [Chloroflexi bacterium]|nr:replication-associated recombination protein A [Chloroflexota bacterium]